MAQYYCVFNKKYNSYYYHYRSDHSASRMITTTITISCIMVNTIYAGTGCAIFGVVFFGQKINFRVSFLVKSQVDINFGASS